MEVQHHLPLVQPFVKHLGTLHCLGLHLIVVGDFGMPKTDNRYVLLTSSLALLQINIEQFTVPCNGVLMALGNQ